MKNIFKYLKMQGWGIALIIFFIIFILVGLGVGIYFVWKHDQDRKKQNGGNGLGINAPSKNTLFSLYPTTFPQQWLTVAGDFVYPINTNDIPCSSLLWEYKDSITNGVTYPNTMLFQIDETGRFLHPADDSNIITIDGISQTVKTLIADNLNNLPSTNDSSWIFKDSRICLQNSPNKCLYATNQIRISAVFLADSTDSKDPGFTWVIKSPPQPPLCKS